MVVDVTFFDAIFVLEMMGWLCYWLVVVAGVANAQVFSRSSVPTLRG